MRGAEQRSRSGQYPSIQQTECENEERVKGRGENIRGTPLFWSLGGAENGSILSALQEHRREKGEDGHEASKRGNKVVPPRRPRGVKGDVTDGVIKV